MDKNVEQIVKLIKLVPTKAGWGSARTWLLEKRLYRGKQQYVAGYSHSRQYSHFANGNVYDRVLGWGETPEAAIKKMRDKIWTLKERAK